MFGRSLFEYFCIIFPENTKKIHYKHSVRQSDRVKIDFLKEQYRYTLGGGRSDQTEDFEI
jgi:hypothetical protein